MKKIICVHLFNDYSGSPLVLSTAIKNFIAEGLEVEIITSGGTAGFLSNIEGATYRCFTYRFYHNKLLRTVSLIWSQLVLFLKLWTYRNEEAVIYVNTLLPFGAAVAGRLMGKRVIYHLHETTVNPPFLKYFLKKIALKTASEAVYVSHFLKDEERLPGIPSRVVYNCLSKEFIEKAEAFTKPEKGPERKHTLLMLCSLKEYKGVIEYVHLADALPEYQFLLVLNSDREAIGKFFRDLVLPDNLVVFPAQKDVHSFYREADLVLNLSHPEKWVETFGMTLLEAMSYGVPVIAPPVGGPAELVMDGYNGYQVDQRDFQMLVQRIRSVLAVPHHWQELSANASAFAVTFSETQFRNKLLQVICAESTRPPLLSNEHLPTNYPPVPQTYPVPASIPLLPHRRN